MNDSRRRHWAPPPPPSHAKPGEGVDVVIIGAGISGLTAAHRLKRAGLDVRVLEASERPGGVMWTEQRDGFTLEKGPFNVIVRDAAFARLLDELKDDPRTCAGAGLRLVTPDDPKQPRFVWARGALRQVPTNPPALLTSPILSVPGRLRLIRGLIASRRPRRDEETIHDAAVRRLGAEATDTLVSALVAGIFGGDIRRLSLQACFPTVARVDRDSGSPLVGMIRAMRAARRDSSADHPHPGPPPQSRRRESVTPPKPRGLITFDGGLAALPAALAKRLGSDLLTNCRATGITVLPDGFEIEAMHDSRARTIAARRLIIATPHRAAASLLRRIAPGAARLLDGIESASFVILNLAYRREQIGRPMRGYGFLVPDSQGEDMPILGALWADSVFPRHAPPTHRLIRIFLGGARDPEAIDRHDEQLLRQASIGLKRSLEIRGEPEWFDVSRFRDAIPQYNSGHSDRLARLRRELASLPALELTGNYLEGVSINDCIRTGTEAADRMATGLMDDRRAAAIAPQSEWSAAHVAGVSAGCVAIAAASDSRMEAQR